MGALWDGMGGAGRVGLDAYAAACNRATGTRAMTTMVDRYYYKAEAVDLGKLWTELGVALVGDRIVLDDAAPQARWRKMIVLGPPGQAPRTVKLPWES